MPGDELLERITVSACDANQNLLKIVKFFVHSEYLRDTLPDRARHMRASQEPDRGDAA